MEKSFVNNHTIKKTIKYNERDYTMIIGITDQQTNFITLHNNDLSIYFECKGIVKLEVDQLYVILTHDKPLQLLDKSTLILFDHYIAVNHNNILTIYDANTLQYIENITVSHTIKAIKITNHFIILDCNYVKDNKIIYHYELFNHNFKHINTINKQIMFIDNSQYKNNFLVLFDDKIATKLNGKYFLYDAEENTYLKIDDTQFNLDNCMIFSSTYNKLNVFAEKETIDCSICFDIITEYHALVPCGHMSLCTSCYKQQNVIKCPICRKNIEQRIKIYK